MTREGQTVLTLALVSPLHEAGQAPVFAAIERALATVRAEFPQLRVTFTGSLKFTVTIERPPQELLRRAGLLPTSRRPEPMSLSTQDEAVLAGKWNDVPADGATYGLRRTIPLVMSPGAQSVASIDRLPLQIAQAV